MTTTVPFYFIDVFAEAPLTGNPLAVVPEADGLDEAELKSIAREFNQSETTFLLPPTDPAATWQLRSFTPAGFEVMGAGHNALGAWWWLAVEGRLELSGGGGHFAQQIGGAVLPVQVVTDSDGRASAIVMEQAPAKFGAVVDRLDGVAAALGLGPGDLRTDIPARVGDTGAGHLLVAAVDRNAVDRAQPDATALREELRRAAGEGCYLYSLDPRHPRAAAYTRFFNPTVGIWEDPATGTAAGPLAAHLLDQRLLPDNRQSSILIEQGHALGRPSLLELRLNNGQVRLSGAGVVVAEGRLRVR